MVSKNFTIAELFEEAKKDSSWETDPKERARLCDMLKMMLCQLS